jgi:hypothetical protein
MFGSVHDAEDALTDEAMGIEDGFAAPEARYEMRESVELAFIAALRASPRRPARGADPARGARLLRCGDAGDERRLGRLDAQRRRRLRTFRPQRPQLRRRTADLGVDAFIARSTENPDPEVLARLPEQAFDPG